ncbi:MAG: TIGR00269 family protein [Candidatus Micrarchaeia archaeon]
MNIKCSTCKTRKAVTRLHYSGRDLCKNCFKKLFYSRAWKANRVHKFLRRGDKIIVAVSGGKDSAATLHVLKKMSEKIGKIKLVPVLIDEGIKGYRDKAITQAKKLCKKEGLKLTVVSFKKIYGASLDQMLHLRKKKTGSCSLCGVFRKHALNKTAVKLKANKVATGHNADDIAQTLLMNIMRKDPQGIARFGPTSGMIENGFVPRIKPLIYNLEKECALYCLLSDLPIHLSQCPNSHESIRGEIRDFLNTQEEKRPGTKFNLVQSCIELQKTALKKNTKTKTGKCTACNSNSSTKTCKACQYLKQLRLAK